MPKYYMTSKVIDNINNANAIELTTFEEKLDGVLNQFFVNTADYSLERWEKEFGIEVNNAYDTALRRTRIISKLRGQGTVTVALLKNVSESFSNGQVDIIEDNTNYKFTVKFVGTLGIPPNLDDLQKAIDDIKPAHLAVNYEFTYLIYSELAASGLTYDQVKALALTYEQLKTWKPA